MENDDKIKSCTKCGSEYVLRDSQEIEFVNGHIPPEKIGYGDAMTYSMKISVCWCMDCGTLLSEKTEEV